MENFDPISFIGNLGFPIFVSWYLLTRVEHKIESLTASIADMTRAIQGWQKEA